MPAHYQVLRCLLILLTTAAGVHAQTHLLSKTLPFERTQNRQVEPLGKILSAAFLEGMLNAYPYAYKDTILLYSEPAKVERPFFRSFEYTYDDTVTYKDKYYRCCSFRDFPVDGLPPSDPESGWYEITELRTPLVTAVKLPERNSVISKTVFMERMLMNELQNWQQGATYNEFDHVVYKGKYYTADTVITEHVPPGQSRQWRPDEPSFYLLSQLTGLSVLYHYRVVNGDSVITPLTITVGIGPENTWSFLMKPVLHFYYDDVITYLSSVNLPLYNEEVNGYLGNGMLELSGRASDHLHRDLRKAIISNQLKLSGKFIKDPMLYRRWMRDSSDYNSYILFQHPVTKEVVVSASHSLGKRGATWKNFLQIPISHIEARMTKVTLMTQLQALLNHKLFTQVDTIKKDSLLNITYLNKVTASEPVKNFSITERFTARIDSGYNASLASVLPLAAKEIFRLAAAGALNPTSPYVEHFPISPDSSENNVAGLYVRSDEFPFKQSRPAHTYPDTPDFTGLSVVYEREAIGTLKPLRVSCDFFDEAIGINVGLWFDYEEVKRAATGSKVLTRFLRLVSKGSFTFNEHELIYGAFDKTLPSGKP